MPRLMDVLTVVCPECEIEVFALGVSASVREVGLSLNGSMFASCKDCGWTAEVMRLTEDGDAEPVHPYMIVG